MKRPFVEKKSFAERLLDWLVEDLPVYIFVVPLLYIGMAVESLFKRKN